MPIVEASGAGARRGPRGGLAAALGGLLETPDPWIRACALFSVGEMGVSELAAQADDASNDDDPVVREAALWASDRLRRV